LVVVLWVLAILVVLAWGLAATVQTEARLVSHLTVSTHCLESARAGVAIALKQLTDSDFSVVSPLSFQSHLSSEDEGIDLRGASFEVSIEDEAGKLNINYATEEMLSKLLDDPELAAAIIDWRDRDDTPGAGGAESSYYLGLDDPYQARNNFFRTVDEIMLVRGMTRERFYRSILGKPPLAELLTVYSVDENVDRRGQIRLNLNTASESELRQRLGDVLSEEDIRAILSFRRGGSQGQSRPEEPESAERPRLRQTPARPPGQPELEGSTEEPGERGERFKSVGDLLRVRGLSREKVRRIADRVTITDERLVPGRVNINTADEAVLACLPGMDETLAREIVEFREGENGPFEDIGELLAIESITPEVYREIAELITVSSTAFRILSIGRDDNGEARATVECVVTMVRSDLRQPSAEGVTGQNRTRPQVIRYYRQRG